MLFIFLFLGLIASTLAKVPPAYFPSIYFSEATVNKLHKNVVVSGHSLLSPLAMLLLAADEKSRQEITEALGYTQYEHIVKSYFKDVIELNYLYNIKYVHCTRFYVDHGAAINPKFISIANKKFNVDIRKMNFKDTRAARIINSWIEIKSNRRIKHIVDQNDISPSTSAMLFNTAQFHAAWEYPFENKLSKMRPFYVKEGQTINVPTMMRSGDYLYSDNTQFDSKIVRIPYKKKECSLLLMIPNKIDGLEKLINDQNNISDFYKAINPNNMSMTPIKVRVPQFKFVYETDLKKMLRELDIDSIFEPGIRLPNMMTKKNELYIDYGKQKIFINVNEFGTGRSGRARNPAEIQLTETQPKIVVEANRPFYFEIDCGPYSLFNGIVVRPGV